MKQMIKRNELVVGPKERAIEAIKAGRKQEAIKCIEEFYEEFRPLHDRYGDWVQSLLGFVSDKLGEEAVEEALYRTFMDVYKDRAISFKDMRHEDIIRRYCQSLRSHYSKFYIEEDEEKTVIVITYCGSGGRMQREGKAYRKRTQKNYPWSFDQAGVSYYCCHEGVFSMAYKELGLDFVRYEYCKQFDDGGKPTGSPCKWIFYKERQ